MKKRRSPVTEDAHSRVAMIQSRLVWVGPTPRTLGIGYLGFKCLLKTRIVIHDQLGARTVLGVTGSGHGNERRCYCGHRFTTGQSGVGHHQGS